MAKIQIITTDENGGGNACEALWYEMADEALDAGHAVSMLVSRSAADHPALRQLIGRGAVATYRWAKPKGGLPLLAHKIWSRTIARWTCSRSVDGTADFVILNVGTLIEVAREPWATVLGSTKVPYGVIVHNNPEIQRYPLATLSRLERLLSNARRVYFVSRRLQSNAEEQMLGRFDSARIARNPVNLSSVEKEPWPQDDGCLHIACVGRLDAYVKGQIRLLHALASEAWRERPWKLSFFGSGPDEALIRKAVGFYGLQDRVRFGGFVTNVRREIWAAHHLLVMPSMLEGMPLTLVEAMICGRPALCSDVGGAGELVADGENGFLAGSPFSGQLAEGLERVWECREKLELMGERAHRDAAAFLPRHPGKDLLSDIIGAAQN